MNSFLRKKLKKKQTKKKTKGKGKPRTRTRTRTRTRSRIKIKNNSISPSTFSLLRGTSLIWNPITRDSKKCYGRYCKKKKR